MSTDPSNSTQDPNNNQDSGTTIQHMMLCDKTVDFGSVHIPALFVAVIGGVLIEVLLSWVVNHIFGTLSTEINFFMGLVRVAGILLVSYGIQRFSGTRNMYPGLWPCGLKPTQMDPAAQAVSKVLCNLGGIKGAACKLGGLPNLVQSVGGLPVLIKSSGGLACLIDEYGTFPDFVCAMGGTAALAAQLPNSNDIYQAMGGGRTSCGNISMPMDNSGQ